MSTEYYKSKDEVEAYIRSAVGVNGGQLIDQLKAFLAPNSSVLELGSGPGSDWKILNEHYNVVGSDLSREFLEHLKSHNPGGVFLEIDAVTLRVETTFDAIYSNKVLHHLKDDELVASIERQSQVLNDDGIVCHSFWKGEGSEFFNEMFVNYHTSKELEAFFGSSFEILLLDPYMEFEENDSLLLIGKKNDMART